MKLCVSSSGCETRLAKGEPDREGGPCRCELLKGPMPNALTLQAMSLARPLLRGCGLDAGPRGVRSARHPCPPAP
jgi:hypothetical protein